MRPVLVIAAGVLLAFPGFGQVRGGGFRTYGSPHGFGNVLFPGVGTAPPLHGGIGFGLGTTHAQRLGATISGFPGYSGTLGRGGLHGRRNVGIPVAVPVFVGGYDYGYYPPAQPNFTVLTPPVPAAPPSPPVVINQYFTPETARPAMREYAPGTLPEPGGNVRLYESPRSTPYPEPGTSKDEQPTIYLVAFKDGSIYAALSYWLEGTTLHYITLQGSHNRATVDLIDRDLSARLNRERGLDFKLPEPAAR